MTLEPSCKDETRVGQRGSLTYVWAEKGSRPRGPRDQQYKWTYIFGAVCPAHGVGAALILAHVNIYAMNLHLNEISTQFTEGACRSHTRRRWLASAGQQTEGVRQHQSLVAAALIAGIEPLIEYLAVPQAELLG